MLTEKELKTLKRRLVMNMSNLKQALKDDDPNAFFYDVHNLKSLIDTLTPHFSELQEKENKMIFIHGL